MRGDAQATRSSCSISRIVLASVPFAIAATCAIAASWRSLHAPEWWDDESNTGVPARRGAGKQPSVPWAVYQPASGGLTNQLIGINIFLGVAWLLNRSSVIPHLGGPQSRATLTAVDHLVSRKSLRNCSVGRRIATLAGLLEHDRAPFHVVCVWRAECQPLARRLNCSGAFSLSCDWGAVSEHFQLRGRAVVAWTQLGHAEKLQTAGGSHDPAGAGAVLDALRAAVRQHPAANLYFTDMFNSPALWKVARWKCPATRDCPVATHGLLAPAEQIIRPAMAHARVLCNGAAYLAAHWRRGDFFEDEKIEVERMAYVIASRSEMAGLTCALLISDASVEEQRALVRLVGKQMPGVQWQTERSIPNASSLKLGGREKDAHALFSKVLAAQAAVFIGTARSTFSGHIQQIRTLYNWQSRHDGIVQRRSRKMQTAPAPRNAAARASRL